MVFPGRTPWVGAGVPVSGAFPGGVFGLSGICEDRSASRARDGPNAPSRYYRRDTARMYPGGVQKLHLAVRNLLKVNLPGTSTWAYVPNRGLYARYQPDGPGPQADRSGDQRALHFLFGACIAARGASDIFGESPKTLLLPRAHRQTAQTLEEHLDYFKDTNGNGVGARQRGQRVNRGVRPVRRQETG